MTEANFLHHPTWDGVTFGNPPSSINLMIHVKGLTFAEYYPKSVIFVEDGLEIRTIDMLGLTDAKKSTARHKDLNDLDFLQP